MVTLLSKKMAKLMRRGHYWSHCNEYETEIMTHFGKPREECPSLQFDLKNSTWIESMRNLPVTATNNSTLCLSHIITMALFQRVI
jgi:hypothetical protein